MKCNYLYDLSVSWPHYHYLFTVTFKFNSSSYDSKIRYLDNATRVKFYLTFQILVKYYDWMSTWFYDICGNISIKSSKWTKSLWDIELSTQWRFLYLWVSSFERMNIAKLVKVECRNVERVTMGQGTCEDWILLSPLEIHDI